MKIAVIQITSVLNYEINLKKIEEMISAAVEMGAKYIFLPEVFYSMSDGLVPTPYLLEEGNEHMKNVQALASKFNITLVGGSTAFKLKNGKIVNRAFCIAPTGEIIDSYDKIHLFACDLPNKKIFESKNYSAGNSMSLTQLDGIKVGMNICFDVRFSEMAHKYRMDGAHLLSYPAAFTVPTGKDHWHTLLRSRAIENQLFVVAAAQWGAHNEKMESYGHSLVIDPWGKILLDLKEGEKFGVVELDFSLIEETRKKVIMY